MVSTYAAPIAANQFFQGLFCRQEASHWRGPRPLQLSAPAVSATENLLDIVRTLCTPESGWPADKPLRPENLLPYVADEAEELLETLHGWTGIDPDVSAIAANPDPAQPESPELFSDLSAFLLWAIAASTPTAMTLLEGVSTKLAGQAEAYGVRLVPVLQVHLEDIDYAFDLATQTSFEPQILLSEDTVLDLPNQDAAALSLAAWRQLIWAEAIALAPDLEPWRQGLAMRVLLPGSPWAPAKATLSLKFVPLTLAVMTAPSINPVWDCPPALASPAMGMPSARIWHAESDTWTDVVDADIIPNGTDDWSQRVSPEADLTFGDRAGLQTAIAALAIQNLLYHRWSAVKVAPELTPLDLVEAAFEVIHSERSPVAQGGQSPLTLTELCHQVKWLWVRASQDLMALMAGISARYLAAGQTWELGTVVTVGQLVIQDGETGRVVVDVSTGDWDVEEPELSPAGILHLQGQPPLAQTLWPREDLAAYCNRLVQGRSPLLAHLMNTVPIQLTSPQDALFPEMTDSELTLQFQIVIHFVS